MKTSLIALALTFFAPSVFAADPSPVDAAIQALSRVLPAGLHHGTSDDGEPCAVIATYSLKNGGYLEVKVMRTIDLRQTQRFIFDAGALAMRESELVTRVQSDRVEVQAGYSDVNGFIPNTVEIQANRVGVQGHVDSHAQFCTID